MTLTRPDEFFADTRPAGELPDVPTEIPRHPWLRDPRYLVGEDGSVVGPSGRILRPWVEHHGYLQVRVSGGSRRLRKNIQVHVMVCEAFHGPRPTGMQAAHRNGDRLDNAASNLRWATPSENEADKVAHGTHLMGERAPRAKLLPGDVVAIRAAVAMGSSRREIAVRYGVSHWAVQDILSGRTWSHLSEGEAS